jgi:hypothetical protein
MLALLLVVGLLLAATGCGAEQSATPEPTGTGPMSPLEL